MKHTLSKALITFAVIIATTFGTSQLASAHNNPYKPDCYPSTTTSTVATTSTSTVPPTTS